MNGYFTETTEIHLTNINFSLYSQTSIIQTLWDHMKESGQSRVRIIENMNINEQQKPAKLIKVRKRHLSVKQHFYESFGIQCRLHLHFYVLWKERIACALKT